MFSDDFSINGLDHGECSLYLGGRFDKMPETIKSMMDTAEKEVIKTSKPKAIYEIFDIDDVVCINNTAENDTNEEISGECFVTFKNTSFKLIGQAISSHLMGCNKAVFLCASIGADIDRLIRRSQLKDMSYAMVVDAMAGVMVEAVCDSIEQTIKEKYRPEKMTFRFGFGYGDLSIEQEKEFLMILKAEKTIGVCLTESFLLTPCKSVACVIGLKTDN